MPLQLAKHCKVAADTQQALRGAQQEAVDATRVRAVAEAEQQRCETTESSMFTDTARLLV